MSETGILAAWKKKARGLKVQTLALYLAYRDPRTPWYAKALALLVAAYAFSPIDLIPDFIPILGYLDDLVIVPLGVLIALRLIPAEVIQESRAAAESQLQAGKPAFKIMAWIVIGIWLIVAAAAGWFIYRAWRG